MSIPLFEQYKQMLTLPAFADFRHELEKGLQKMKEDFWKQEAGSEEEAALKTKIKHYEEFLGGINKILLDKQKKD